MYTDYKITNTRNGLYKYIFEFEYTTAQRKQILDFYINHPFFMIEPICLKEY